jgi:uracil-DNA glycosylase family 4
LSKEACFTPLFGDNDTKIMLVAEAPSVRKNNVGSYVGGMLKDVPGKNLSSIRDFIKKHYNTTPYFTDLMKCGAEKQTREVKSRIFEIRTENCVKHYLLKEIRIIKPKILICLGWRSFSKLKKVQNEKIIPKNIKVINLLHYGSQANLPLTSQDKLNYIWPVQIGKLKDTNLRRLSFFRKHKHF